MRSVNLTVFCKTIRSLRTKNGDIIVYGSFALSQGIVIAVKDYNFLGLRLVVLGALLASCLAKVFSSSCPRILIKFSEFPKLCGGKDTDYRVCFVKFGIDGKTRQKVYIKYMWANFDIRNPLQKKWKNINYW